jgi:hypothetical protein
MRRVELEVLRRPEELSQGRGTVTTPGLTQCQERMSNVRETGR